LEYIASLFLGLGNGGVYAALAVAIVLTYRSSGVLNFATGAVALYAAYTYGYLRNGQLPLFIPGLPVSVGVGGSMGFVPAAALALAMAALIGALLYLLVFRPLRQASQLATAIASLGVLVVLQTDAANRLGTSPVSAAPIFPQHTWRIGSLLFLSDRVYLVATVAVLTLVVTALYRWTPFGLATRATAETETGAFVTGVAPDRVALFNWIISAVVAGIAGILIAGVTPLTPVGYTLFVVPALAAALVGGFQYLVPTLAAGIGIGMLQGGLVTVALRNTWLPQTGVQEIVPIAVILLALLVRGRSMPERGAVIRRSLGAAPRPRSLTFPTVVGSAAGVLLLVLTHGSWRGAVIVSIIFAVIGLSQVVVTGFAGQVSMAQLGLAGCAAMTLSFLTQSWHIPFPLGPLLASLVAALIGAVVGLPALRLRGLLLGVVTLALADVLENVWFDNIPLGGAQVNNPKLFGLNLGIGSGLGYPRLQFGLFCLIVLVAVAWGVAKLRKSALGSAMLAVRANETSAAGVGVSVVWVKVISFAIASFIAGIGGSLLAYDQGISTAASFTAIGGLAFLTTVYLAGITSVSGGILSGILAASGLVAYASSTWFNLGIWFPAILGLVLVVNLIIYPEGLATAGHRLADRFARARASRTAADAPAPAIGASAAEPAATPVTAGPPPAPLAAAGDTLLEVSRITVRYGGVVAVSDVSLKVPAGTVVGLIGPNGAGKTSFIDGLTGFARAEGEVELKGRRIDHLRPHSRVHGGLARTFQSLDLYDDLTVDENVSAALYGEHRRDRARATKRALDLVGIADLRQRKAGQLSQGQRQLVSIARACAARPSVLLLDEPAAGLDTSESQWLAERIRNVKEAGAGVLLVDHDVALVLSVCDYIYVLNFGKVIAEGDPAAIRSDRAVAEAYLGSSHSAEVATA
jgi:sulfate-transporting ATPase